MNWIKKNNTYHRLECLSSEDTDRGSWVNVSSEDHPDVEIPWTCQQFCCESSEMENGTMSYKNMIHPSVFRALIQNIKMSSYQDMIPHCGDKTILRPSHLLNGISYAGKTTSLYWIGAQFFFKKKVAFPSPFIFRCGVGIWNSPQSNCPLCYVECCLWDVFW